MKKIKTNKKIKRKVYSNQKGITLVALVVTIVVLLILAGVSVNALFGNGGIIKKAQEAQNTMDKATQNDLAQIDELDSWIENNVNGNSTESSTLVKQITNNETKSLEGSIDYTGQEGLQIDYAIYDVNNGSVLNIKKLEILSGCTTKNVEFKNCEEVIIYSNAVIENVTFNAANKITIYSGAQLKYCVFDDNVNIKMMEAIINGCNFKNSNITFEKCTILNSNIETSGPTVKYTNCTVDGEPYSN